MFSVLAVGLSELKNFPFFSALHSRCSADPHTLKYASHGFRQTPLWCEQATSRRHQGTGLVTHLSQTRGTVAAEGTLPSPSHDIQELHLSLPSAASPSQEEHGRSSFFCPSSETASKQCPPSFSALVSFPKTSFFFFLNLRQMIQLKKSPSIKTCLTSPCLSKTMTFSPL